MGTWQQRCDLCLMWRPAVVSPSLWALSRQFVRLMESEVRVLRHIPWHSGTCLLLHVVAAAPDGSLAAQLVAARPAKRRKIVDRRASKGRKLRFHTLDRLVGFMAPTQLTTPPFADQLFANLFTHDG